MRYWETNVRRNLNIRRTLLLLVMTYISLVASKFRHLEMRGVDDEVVNDYSIDVAEWQKGLADRHKGEEVT